MQVPLFQQTSNVLSVSELTRKIRGTLETRFSAVWVHGEVSNHKRHPSGHQYFTLKDAHAQIACVIWRDTAASLRSDGGRSPLPADGAQVQISGTITVFEARGQYQINVQTVESLGSGLLQAKFEALKRRLEAEGLFAPGRKRPLPKFPRRIGIVTSPSGAAIRDMLNILRRRAPWLQTLINPVRVQGTGAAREIAVAIRELATPAQVFAPVDMIVVARGGGSLEDLWEFNEEIVARTIIDVPVPIVSAIGHEIDFTICDFVADLRAPTPSAAAELIVPDIVDLRRRLDSLAGTLAKSLRTFVETQKTRLRFLSERALARELLKRLHDAQQQVDLARESLHRLARQKIDHCRQLLNRFDGILRVLGPEATLRRGFSITMDERGEIIRTASTVRPKMKIKTRVADGEFESEAL